MEVFLRKIKKKNHKAKRIELGAWLGDALAQTGASTFYSPGIASAFCIFILILHRLTPCHSFWHPCSFLVKYLQPFTYNGCLYFIEP